MANLDELYDLSYTGPQIQQILDEANKLLLGVYATQAWVTSRGYITSSALNGYATQQWVGQQGYITSSTLSYYATKQWVQDQGYLTSASLSASYVSIDNNGIYNHQVITDNQIYIYGNNSDNGGLVICDANQQVLGVLSANISEKLTWNDALVVMVSDLSGYSYGYSVYGGLTSEHSSVGANEYVRFSMPFTFDSSDGGTVIPAFLPLSGGTINGNLRLQDQGTSTGYVKQYFQIGGSGVNYYFEGYYADGSPASADINFNLQGTVKANGTILTSDSRLKNIVSNETLSSDSIATMPLVKFSWKNDERKRVHFGSIAQDWQKIIPEVVEEDKNGMLSLNYDAAAMAAGVTACREIVRLKKEISELKSFINSNIGNYED